MARACSLASGAGSHGEGRKSDQTGLRRPEATSVEVERPKLRLEVDVQPLAARRLRVHSGQPNELRPDPTTLERPMRLRIEQECMVAPVPGDVHEPDELGPASRSDPPEAERSD